MQNVFKTFFKKVRSLGLLCLMLFLVACGQKNAEIVEELPPTPPSEAEAMLLWESFIKQSTIETKPYAYSGSFRFGYDKDTRRVNYILWGNNEELLRLDIRAGIGTSIAKIEETDENIKVYLEYEENAHKVMGEDRAQYWHRLGMPFPISFRELSHVLHGQFAKILPQIELEEIEFAEKKSMEEKYLFKFKSSSFSGTLRLNEKGELVECITDDFWKITVEYFENAPYRVDIVSLADGYKAILLIKERKYPDPYKEEALKLRLPEGMSYTKLILE